MCVHTCGLSTVRGGRMTMYRSLVSPSTMWILGWNSSHQAWQWGPLPAEPPLPTSPAQYCEDSWTWTRHSLSEWRKCTGDFWKQVSKWWTKHIFKYKLERDAIPLLNPQRLYVKTNNKSQQACRNTDVFTLVPGFKTGVVFLESQVTNYSNLFRSVYPRGRVTPPSL